jgi:hypothetical protein
MTADNKNANLAKKAIYEQIRDSLNILAGTGQVVELRVLNLDSKACTASGYFDDFAKLASRATHYDGRGQVTVTLNPVLPDLKARAYNRMQEWAKHTTKDAEIVCRQWLMLDFDPKRPAGISATDEEHETALERAFAVRDHLIKHFSWSEPLVCDSGNGAHLLYRLNMPNDDKTEEKVKQVLKALESLFSDDLVQLDTGVFNPARLVKLYGTLAVKGDNLPERPHRRSRILSVPQELIELGKERLNRLIEELLPKTETVSKNENIEVKGDDVLAQIKNCFDIVAYATRYFSGEVIAEGKNEVRILGNRGLLLNTEKHIWYQHGVGVGGDIFDLVGYIMYSENWDKHNKEMFKTVLAEAARFTGVELKNKSNELTQADCCSQAEELIEQIKLSGSVKLVVLSGNSVAIRLDLADKKETWQPDSPALRLFLAWYYHQTTKKDAPEEVLDLAQNILEKEREAIVQKLKTAQIDHTNHPFLQDRDSGQNTRKSNKPRQHKRGTKKHAN